MLKYQPRIEPLEQRDLLAIDLLGDLPKTRPLSSLPSEFLAFEDHALFRTESEGKGQLWTTDGTTEGTKQLQSDAGPYHPQRFQQDVVYLSGGVLWRSNVSGDSALRLTDDDITIRGRDLMVFGDHIYFNGRDRNLRRSPLVGGGSHNGFKLMRSDGTPQGVEYFHLPEGISRTNELERIVGVWDEKLHYSTGKRGPEQYWTTDGSHEGTQMWDDYPIGVDSFEPTMELNDLLVGTSAYLWNWRPELAIANSNTMEPLFFDLNPGPDGSYVGSFVNSPQGLFFLADDGEHGIEIWTTDGHFIAGADAPDGAVLVYTDRDSGLEPIGYAPSTRRLTNLADGQSPEWLTWHNNALYFSHKSGLWEYNTGDESTRLIKQFESTPVAFGPRWLTPVDDNLYFTAYGSEGEELWKTDGTSEGTVVAADIVPGPEGSQPSGITRFQNNLLFAAATPQFGRELWTYDVPSGNASLIKDINDATMPQFRFPRELVHYHDRIFFRIDDGIHGAELWSSDGTTAGTSLFLDINPGKSSSGPGGFFKHNDELYFIANDGIHGNELWKTDGNAANTKLVKDIWPGADGVVDPEYFRSSGDFLYFTANDGTHGAELWMTDGTKGGTQLVIDLAPGPAHPGNPLLATNDEFALLYNSNPQDRNDRGLWKIVGDQVEEVASGGLSLGFNDLIDIHLINDRIYLHHDRLNRLEEFDPRQQTLKAIGVSNTHIWSLGQTGAFFATKNGVYTIDTLGEVSLVEELPVRSGSSPIDGALAVDDRIYYWRNETPALEQKGFIKTLAAGESLPRTLLVGDQHYGTVKSHGNELLVEVVQELGESQLWKVSQSPLGTYAISTPIASPYFSPLEFAVTSERILFGARTEFGESLFFDDMPLANAKTGKHRITTSAIDLLFSEIESNSNRRAFDVNTDSQVDLGDVEFLFRNVLGTQRGDLDINGTVDFDDFLTLSANYGKSNATWSEGDANGDGSVSFADFLLLSAAFGSEA